MTLANYLETPQAREDVGRMVAAPAGIIKAHRVDGGFLVRGWKDAGAWFQVGVIKGDFERTIITTAYYRPDGDRFVVTDLGEGVRALRLRTGCSQYLAMERSDPMREDLRTSGTGNIWTTERGIMELDNVTAADLPEAICRVMLASLNVAGARP